MKKLLGFDEREFGYKIFLWMQIIQSTLLGCWYYIYIFQIWIDFMMSKTFVVDPGSGSIKAGWNSSESKCEKIPSMIGQPKYNSELELCVGKEIARVQKSMYKFKYPIQRGLIQNEEEMEILWKFLLNRFNVSPKENQILLTEPMNSDKSKKKSITEIMLEKYQFSSLAFSKQGVLPLFALGMTSGTVVQSGQGLTQIVPIFDGFSKDECWTQINFGGKQVTLHLRDLMRKIGVNMDTSAELEEVREIKQKICMKEKQKENEKTQYVLPDGKKVSFSSTQKLAPEILFNPSKVGFGFPSLPQILVNVLEKVDLDLQFELFNNIVLSGGNTMFENFSMKFIESLRSILPDLNNCRVKDVPKRDVLCWQGANILADHSLFDQINITPQEYKEHGDSIFLKKKF